MITFGLNLEGLIEGSWLEKRDGEVLKRRMNTAELGRFEMAATFQRT